MRSARRIGELMLPWAGLIGGGAGWALSQQLGSDLSAYSCRSMSPPVALLIGALGLALAVGGGVLAHRHWRRGEAGRGARHFLSLMGMIAAALFAIAIVWQTSAALLIPRCYG